MTAQTEAIHAHLLKHDSITQIQAQKKFRCFRLAPRIFELRKKGLDVQTVMIKRNGKRYAKYVYMGRRNGRTH
jgi:hypothetical protein